MEQAVNMFNNGLQMDSHPMITGNDVLTDALNATFVTMNGNEVILQNDMGNRKIDRAFLPSGYEPVGIKEYGGIIYIAAYNPLTNRSQIGSFPSPERHLSTNDGSMLNPIPVNLEDYFKCEDNKLYQDSYLIPLTGQNVLHAGDKFVVYCQDLWSNDVEWDKKISNFNNTDTEDGKVISPKNKCYTLSLGVLNSQNEFVDITNTLHRWKKGKPRSMYQHRDGNYYLSPEEGFTGDIRTFNNFWEIQDYTTESDLYKFNDGYFIPSYSTANGSAEYTISDYLLLQNREVQEANTYAYKLVGPLYLKIQLNHIQEFNYTLSGERNGNTANLYIDAYIKYNCPDKISGPINDEGDDNYKKYDIGYPVLEGDNNTQYWFDVSITGQDDITIDESGFDDEQPTNNPITYNPITNLYTARIVKKVGQIQEPSGDIFEYNINVPYNSEISCTVPGLNSSGTLEFSKLGSGEVELIGWRFSSRVNDRQSVIAYNFLTYLRHRQEVEPCTFEFYKVTESGVSGESKITKEVKVGNGTLILDWDDYNISERSLYKVVITYTDKTVSANNRTYVRWFLNTELMNDCYQPSSSLYIQDFGNPKNDEETILEDKLTIKLSPEINYKDNSKPINAEAPTNGSWLVKNPSGNDIDVVYNNKLNVDIDINLEIKINNENLYPDFIILPNVSNLQNAIELSNDNNIDNILKIVKGIDYFKKGNVSSSEDSHFLIEETLVKNNNKITGIIEYKDIFHGTIDRDSTRKITNAFGKFTKFLRYSIAGKEDYLTYYGGIQPCHDDDDKFIESFYAKSIYNNSNSKKQSFYELAPRDKKSPKYFSTQDQDDNNQKTYHNMIEYKSKKMDFSESVLSLFDNIEKQTFIYMFGDEEGNVNNRKRAILASTYRSDYQEQNFNKMARVWWKTNDGSWALFINPYRKQSDTTIEGFCKFITDQCFGVNDPEQGKTIYYCFSQEVTASQYDLYLPQTQNYKYNDLYSFQISPKFTVNKNNINIPGIDSNTSIQCYKKMGNNGNTNQKKILFKYGNITDISSKLKSNIYSSSEIFQDMANKIINGIDLQNICIDDGASLNDINSFYYKINSKYKKLNLPIFIDFNNTISSDGIEYNTLLYKGKDKDQVSYKYDVTFHDSNDLKSHDCYINYDNVRTVRHPLQNLNEISR